jgi:pimeloyl-ACP methyl ester carboxylesterase
MELSHQLWRAKHSEKGKLVLLHGMGGTGALWRPVAAALEDHFTILAPDQRGHGGSRVRSRIALHYAPLDYGRDLVDTLDSLKFHPAWIVGHSMGVRSACALAHLKPGWVEGMALVDRGFSGVAGGGLGEGLATFIRILPERFNSRAEARGFMEQNCPDPSIAQYLMAVSIPTPDGGIRFPFDQGALIETIRAARDVSVRKWVEEFGSLGKKVLVLRGANSQVWSHEEFLTEKERFTNISSVEFREFPNAGHGLPYEQRLRFVQELRALMAKT